MPKILAAIYSPTTLWLVLLPSRLAILLSTIFLARRSSARRGKFDIHSSSNYLFICSHFADMYVDGHRATRSQGDHLGEPQAIHLREVPSISEERLGGGEQYGYACAQPHLP